MKMERVRQKEKSVKQEGKERFGSYAFLFYFSILMLSRLI